MMQEAKSRVLIVSGRLLMAQGLKSLLADEPEISQVEVIGSLYDALVYSLSNPPDAMVIDLPAGADLFVDRPISVDGHEIKTIVMVEGDRNVEARLYVHVPGSTANLDNLMAAILWDGQGHLRPGAEPRRLQKPASEPRSGPPADAPVELPHIGHPSNLMRARASGPSKPRMSSSNDAS
jgi:hypothetical protein